VTISSTSVIPCARIGESMGFMLRAMMVRFIFRRFDLVRKNRKMC
jgi:hypothetical protein